MKTQAIILGVSVGLLTFANAVLSATYVVVPDEEPVRHPSTAPITEMTLLSSRLTHRTIVVATIAEQPKNSTAALESGIPMEPAFA